MNGGRRSSEHRSLRAKRGEEEFLEQPSNEELSDHDKQHQADDDCPPRQPAQSKHDGSSQQGDRIELAEIDTYSTGADINLWKRSAEID